MQVFVAIGPLDYGAPMDKRTPTELILMTLRPTPSLEATGRITIMKKRRVLFALLSFVAMLSAGSARAQERLVWVPLDGQSAEGSPVRAVALKTAPEGTTLEVTVPGVWMETVSYGGK